jgi:hypothetical protein
MKSAQGRFGINDIALLISVTTVLVTVSKNLDGDSCGLFQGYLPKYAMRHQEEATKKPLQ